MANRRFIDFPIAASVGDNDIVLIWQDGLNKQTTKATLLQGSPSSLAGLTDVDIAAITNGQILQYNSTTSKWENVDRTDINLSELGDVTIVAPANGQVLVYNSSTSKWENSSAGYVPYTGAVTTVNLGAQTIQAGSFVKAGGTAAQFLKADGSVDSSTYGTGTVTSVALTMPTAFSVANSPVTTAGTLAVTATGTTSQYIRGDGSLETFPALTGFVPYTGATADVNLGTFDLLAERGTFENNGSSNTLTVNHTSGSGYGIIVTKGGNNEALYVSKTSGSGNAMTVVGGRTSLVDLALSSVTNTAGDFLTLSGGVVHKRTAAQTLTDIGGQAALTNPVTGTGTSGQVAYFTGTSAISSESNLFWDATNDRLGIGIITPNSNLQVVKGSSGNISSFTSDALDINNYSGITINSRVVSGVDWYGSEIRNINTNGTPGFLNPRLGFFTQDNNTFLPANRTEKLSILGNGDVGIGTNVPSFKLDVNGTGRFSGAVSATNGLFNSDFLANETSKVGISFASGYGQINSWGANTSTYGGLKFQLSASNGGTFTPLTLLPSGAATFSSSVTANGAKPQLYVKGDSGNGAGIHLTTDLSGSNRRNWGIFTEENIEGDFAIKCSTAAGGNPGSGDTRFLITSGGNVGIGTDNPGARLTILTPTSDSTVGFNLRAYASGADGDRTVISRYTSSNDNNWANSVYRAWAHIYETNGTEKMRITSGGEVLVGGNTDNGAYNLQCNGTGVWGAGAYVNGSDRNIKDNISTIEKGLEYIEKMNPVRFKYKPNYTRDHTMQTGFIAQELQEVFANEDYLSGLVQNGVHLSVAYQNLLPILVKAIQELKTQVDNLKN
jgi:hypothetical protein